MEHQLYRVLALNDFGAGMFQEVLADTYYLPSCPFGQM